MRASQFVSIFKRDNGAGFAYDTNYQAVLDRATTLGYSLPTDAQKLVQNQLIIDLKAAGIWAKLDVFYSFANNGSKEFATLNWVNPSNHQATLVNSPTFTSNVGFNGDGASAYINLNINPSTQLTKASIANASRFLYKSSQSANGFLVGIPASTADRWNGASDVGWSIHAQQNASLAAISTAAGFHMISRSSSTACNHRSPTVSTNATTTVNTLPNANLCLLVSNTSYAHSSIKLYCFGYGSNLESDHATLKSTIDAYIGAL